MLHCIIHQSFLPNFTGCLIGLHRPGHIGSLGGIVIDGIVCHGIVTDGIVYKPSWVCHGIRRPVRTTGFKPWLEKTAICLNMTRYCAIWTYLVSAFVLIPPSCLANWTDFSGNRFFHRLTYNVGKRTRCPSFQVIVGRSYGTGWSNRQSFCRPFVHFVNNADWLHLGPTC